MEVHDEPRIQPGHPEACAERQAMGRKDRFAHPNVHGDLPTHAQIELLYVGEAHTAVEDGDRHPTLVVRPAKQQLLREGVHVCPLRQARPEPPVHLESGSHDDSGERFQGPRREMLRHAVSFGRGSTRVARPVPRPAAQCD